MKKLLLIFLLFTGLSLCTRGQQKTAPEDTAKVYREIETYSKKTGFTGFIYGLFFKPVEKRILNPEKSKKKKISKSHKLFEGKVIRNIDVITLDPFGYSVDDTSVVIQNSLYKTGNKLHLKSQEITIRNLLLIHKNDIYDSLYVKETERLIRSQKYVQRVAIFTTLTGRNKDSVNIVIRVMDFWTIIPAISVSPTRVTFGLRDKNFLGLGHDFQNSFTWNHSNGNNVLNSNYYIPNIRNTYINTLLHYGIDENNNHIKSINVERPFFSPLAKWAAGTYFDQQTIRDTIVQRNPDLQTSQIEYTTQDYWGGASQQIFKGNSETERTTSLIFTLRYLRRNFLKTPGSEYDPDQVYANEDFYLSGIGLSTRKYVQDKYIFNFGWIEDVPVGIVYGLTGGYQVKNSTGRFYAGARFSFGSYYDWGFMSTNFEYGTYFLSSQSEQSVFTAELKYFTELFEIGDWKFRQFIKPQISLGFNRISSDILTINNENGIPGFRSTSLSGTKKLLLTFQTQSYAPWNIIGFRFGPYLTCSLGMLGDEINGFKKSKVYSQLGFGFLIKNDFLVFEIIQISFAYYPSIPGSGNDIFKINPGQTKDFGFQNFELGKPTPVVYR